MQQSLQVTFKDVQHSDAVELVIRERVERIERFLGQL